MDGQDVTIRLESRQDMDGQLQRTHQLCRGTLLREEGRWILRWQETPEAGLGNTASVLSLYSGGAVLERTGETAAKMIFRVGKTFPFDYRTPYGTMPMALTARQVGWKLGEEGGTVSLDYDLTLGGGPGARTSLLLTVRPAL